LLPVVQGQKGVNRSEKENLKGNSGEALVLRALCRKGNMGRNSGDLKGIAKEEKRSTRGETSCAAQQRGENANPCSVGQKKKRKHTEESAVRR